MYIHISTNAELLYFKLFTDSIISVKWFKMSHIFTKLGYFLSLGHNFYHDPQNSVDAGARLKCSPGLVEVLNLGYSMSHWRMQHLLFEASCFSNSCISITLSNSIFLTPGQIRGHLCLVYPTFVWPLVEFLSRSHWGVPCWHSAFLWAVPPPW